MMEERTINQPVNDGEERHQQNNDDYDFYRRMAESLSHIASEGGNYSERYNQLNGLVGQGALSGEDLSKAYYASDLFKERAALCLGYASIDEVLQSPHKGLYEKIVVRGLSAITDTDVFPSSSRGPVSITYEDGTTSIYADDKEYLGFNDMSHEFGHHLYTNAIDETLNPGVHEKPNKYMTSPEVQYGKKGSPLSTINKDESNAKRMSATYHVEISQVLSEYYDLDKDEQKQLDQKLKEAGAKSLEGFLIANMMMHDNSGVERAADVHGVRAQMFLDGIWNQFDGSLLTLEQVKAYHKLHPNARIFNYWSEKQALFYLNNIAYNEKPTRGVELNQLKDCSQNLLASLSTPSDQQINRTSKQEIGETAVAISHAQYEQLSQENSKEQTHVLRV